MKVIICPVGMMKTNCYLAVDESSRCCAVIDPGDCVGTILHEISTHSLSVDKILLTHGHFDHVLALNELRKAVAAPVFIHRAEEKFLTDRDSNLMNLMANGAETPVPADILLEDGDTIRIGAETLTVLHTPGHTPGSCCYVGINGCDCLFSGDTLFHGCVGRCDLPGSSSEQMEHSLRRLAALPRDYRVYPGHGGNTRLSTEINENPFMNSVLNHQ